ncbi:5894_t:CDS:2, partial [Ambispora leptoticha]
LTAVMKSHAQMKFSFMTRIEELIFAIDPNEELAEWCSSDFVVNRKRCSVPINRQPIAVLNELMFLYKGGLLKTLRLFSKSNLENTINYGTSNKGFDPPCAQGGLLKTLRLFSKSNFENTINYGTSNKGFDPPDCAEVIFSVFTGRISCSVDFFGIPKDCLSQAVFRRMS